MTAAALLDLLFNRLLLPTWGGELNRNDLLRLIHWGSLPRNLAALTGIVAIIVGLHQVLRSPRSGSLIGRVCVAVAGGAFVPTVLMAAVMPRAQLSVGLVLVSLLAANWLVVFVAVFAVRRTPDVWLRTSLVGVGISAGASLMVIALVGIRGINDVVQHTQLALWTRHAGEVSWLLGGLAPLGYVWKSSQCRRRHLLLWSLGMFGLVYATLAIGTRHLSDSELSTVIYGATRLVGLLDIAPHAYLVVLGAMVTVAVAAPLDRRPQYIQMGLGLLCWLAGGYAARAPARLLYAAAGAVLMARSMRSVVTIRTHSPELSQELQPQN